MKENSVRLWLRKGCGVLVVNALLLGMLGAPEATRAENTRHTDGRGTVKLVIPAPGGGAVAKGREGAEEFLVAHQSEFKLPGDLANLEWVSKHESLLGTHYRYRQMLNAVPVDGADVVVSVGRDSGEVYQAYNNTYPVEESPAAPGKVMGEEAALDAAWQHLRVHGPLLGGAQAGLVYLPEKGGFRLAYKTYVPVAAPKGYWEHRIDAVTGEVLGVRDTAINESKRARQLPVFGAYSGAVWSREEARRQWELAAAAKGAGGSVQKNTVNGSALVFDSDPRTYLADASLVDSSPASAFTGAYVMRTLRDISEDLGVYSLDGPWVTIVDFEAPNTAPSTTTNGQWTAERGNNAFNDAMTYFHIDQNQRYLQSLGYTGAAGIQAGAIQVDSDGLDGDDNSYYLPGLNRLAFGHGDVDDNEDADVILHEYGHAITFGIVSSWGGGDTGAIGEGFGDYWGASYSSTTANGQVFHPEWAFSWDGHSADTWSGRFLNLTNLTYDPTYTYDAHETIQGVDNYSDQLWSAPLFQAFLRLRSLGYARTNIDRVVVESFFGMGGSPKMRDLAYATVNAAARLFPSEAYAEVFREQFAQQRILPAPPVPAPVLLAPVGGESFATGSVVQVRWERQGAPSSAAARLEYSAGSATNFSDSMESGVNGWVASHGSGANNWTQANTSSHSPTHSWFAPDPNFLSDMYLQSPLLTIGSGDVLSFWHSYDTESGYDGGVVEVSMNGTTWVDLGGNSTQNGYNGSISSIFSSPIAGRAAFTGNSGGYIETKISLTAYAGQSVYIRFRAASDSSEFSTGWYVDDVSISRQWVSIGTTVANASSYLWTLPGTLGTNYLLRVQQFATGYSDSAWVQSSFFTVEIPARPSIQNLVVTNGAVTLTWSSVGGKSYRVEYKTNLTEAAWSALAPDVIAGGVSTSFTDPSVVSRRFYRILAL